MKLLRHAPLWIALLLVSCDGSSDDKDDPDPGDGGGEPDSDWSVSAFDLSVCIDPPTARSRHAMAPFFASPPISVGGRMVERGFIVVGGKGTGGAFNNDLWVFDRSSLRPSACPWILVASTGALNGISGVADATVGWNNDLRVFLLAGGIEEKTDGTLISGSTGWVADGDDLATGFNDYEILPSATQAFETIESVECWAGITAVCPDDDDPCAEPQWEDKAVANPCDGTLATECVQGAETFLDNGGDSWHTPFIDGCADDPSCLAEPGVDALPNGRIVFAQLPGNAQAIGAFDPAAGALQLFGGTTGCGTGSCTGWKEFTDANVFDPWKPVIYGSTFQALANRDDVTRWDGYNPPELDSLQTIVRPTEWPADASTGLRLGDGLVQAEWDLAARAYINSEEPWLVGGTFHQEIAPQATWFPDALGEEDDLCLTAAVQAPVWSVGYWEAALWSDWFEDEDEDEIYSYRDALGPPLWRVVNGVPEEKAPAGLPERIGTAAEMAGTSAFVIAGGELLDGSFDPKIYAVEELAGNALSVKTVPSQDPLAAPLPMSGAGLAYDPIDKSVYLFGGSDDATVYEIRSPDSAPVNAGTWSIVEASAEWRHHDDAGDGHWTFTGVYQMQAQCIVTTGPDPDQDYATPCALDEVAVHFTDGDDDGDAKYQGIDDARVWADAGTGPREITGRRLELADAQSASGMTDITDRGGLIHSRSWRLAEIVPDGEMMTLTVEVDVPDESTGQQLHSSTKFGVHNVKVGSTDALAPCEEEVVRLIHGVAAFPGENPVADPSPGTSPIAYPVDELPELLPLRHIHLVGAADDVAVGPGAEEDCDAADYAGFDGRPGGEAFAAGDGTCFHLPESTRLQDGLAFRAISMPGLVKVSTTDDVEVWRSSCLTDGPAIDAHVAPGGVFEADRTWLAGKLGGAGPFTTTSVVLTPGCLQKDQCFDAGTAGDTRAAQILISANTPEGDPMIDPPDIAAPDLTEATLLHEWTHGYAGWGRLLETTDVGWFTEGFCSLVETMRYAHDGETAYRLVKGHGATVANALSASAQARELRSADLSASDKGNLWYSYAPWVIGQAIEMGTAIGGPGTGWAGMAGFLVDDATDRAPLYSAADGADVAALMNGVSGSGTFQALWVEDPSAAPPTVSITNASFAAGTLQLTVEQILASEGATAWQFDPDTGLQVGATWPTYPAVPFRIACREAWPGCNATDAGPIGAARVLTGASTIVTITGIPAEAVEVALVANGRLFPDSLPSYAESDGVTPVEPRQQGLAGTRTWFTVCQPGTADSRCQVDNDGDGWFDANVLLPLPSPDGDCNEYFAAAHPGASDPHTAWGFPIDESTLPALDLNCDGAPEPAWYNPILLPEEETP